MTDTTTNCDHTGERTRREAHGYLADAPAGTIQLLCGDCGAVLCNRVTKKSSGLREGDVVLNHGMRLLIDRPIKTFDENAPHGPVFHTPALVLNPEAIADDRFISYFVNEDNGRWTIQGNDLARWVVEVPT